MQRGFSKFRYVSAALVALSPILCGEIRVLALTTSAAFVSGMPGPGSLATIFCTGLEGIGAHVSSELPLPRTLAGVRVSFGGMDAPLLAVVDLGAFQIVNFQVPWEETAPGAGVVSLGGNRAVLPTEPAPWGQFFVDPMGVIYALHVIGYRPVTASDPARPGEWIMLLGTNFGAVVSPPASGTPASAQPLPYLDPGSPIGWTFAVYLNQSGQSRPLESNYAGLAPGTVGVYQINVRMPMDLTSDAASLFMQRSRFCGFFFTPGCGRGQQLGTSSGGNLPVAR